MAKLKSDPAVKKISYNFIDRQLRYGKVNLVCRGCMKYKIKFIIFSLSMLLAGLNFFNCNAYDLLGQLNAGAPPPVKLRVFLTSLTTLGDMNFNARVVACPGNGISNANCACNYLALSAGLTTGTKKFNAWLSDSATDAACNIIGGNGSKLISNCNGYSSGQLSFVDVNGNTVFNSYQDIMAGVTPATLINLDESKTNHSYSSVWTGTNNNGTGTSYYCNNGTSDWGSTSTPLAYSGTFGSDNLSANWSNYQTTTCDASLPIYCFEQP